MTDAGLPGIDAVDAAPSPPALMGCFMEVNYCAWRNVVTTQNLKVD